jgi:glycosyltransferase involved in cell wall biosynthesis
MILSPVCLFTYNRLDETKKTILALNNNYLASVSDLFIFSDGWKDEISKESVQCVRKFLTTIDGFKSVTVIERPENYGLAKSIITGVTDILDKYGRVIVLEDDLITSTNFLSYMNQALSFYRDNNKVWSISGFSFPIQYPKGYEFDNSFGVRASSWGWATWKDRWSEVDWKVSDYEEFMRNKSMQKQFKQGGSDLVRMLSKQMSGTIDSWAIRFTYSQFKHGSYDVLPVQSKVVNIGFNGDATNTQGMETRFGSTLDKSGNTVFVFNEAVSADEHVLRQFRKPLTIKSRVKYKISEVFKKLKYK